MNADPEFAKVMMGLCVGIGLSAACGFRVFVPMLFLSIASRAGQVELSTGWEWLGSVPAIAAFGTATALEVGAYYIPWLDNLLDSIAAPAAVVAGTVVTASCVGDISPMLKWGLALVAGGGSAAAVQGITMATRAISTATTGGLGNPAVSTAEAGASFGLSLMALLIPMLAAALVVLTMFFGIRLVARKLMIKKETAPEKTEAA